MEEPVDITKKPLPAELYHIARLVKLMDSQFRLPGTGFTFGIDPLLNFFPGLGWAIDFGISMYLFLAMVRNGASGTVVSKMLLNIGIDSLVGAIPVIGNIFDFVFKANRRNLILAAEHFGEGKHPGNGWQIWLPVMIFVLVIFGLIGFLSYYFIHLLTRWIAGS